ncbi:hypothetical protein OGAPHI_006527 [Ogataea philodendri]|uniref:Skg3/CAF120-like PH-like domain-containing protein n=1 Tax=Ogataea philodendri TaxID=1378263 RepID=A0A9P8NYR5_9ASCO|nr:uncharacterized protein OGAPHI_006527 [Ogataea philodendri]KAH3661677.1 hypothetical protein OGAPHI_006527 [Ogataea philodendri]
MSSLKKLFRRNKSSSSQSLPETRSTKKSEPSNADSAGPTSVPLTGSRTYSDSIKNSRAPRRASRTDSKRLSSLPTTFLRQGNSPAPRTLSLGNALAEPKDNINKLPEELVPVVTLLHAQNARSYCEMSVQVPLQEADSLSWVYVSAKLSGTELAIWEMDSQTSQELRNDDNGGFKPIYINILDAHYSYSSSPDKHELKITLTESRLYLLKFDSKQDIDRFYAALLLAQFENRQLQESFTGALFSSKAIYFSDIRTLLAPTNNNAKEEWCVLRFPFLNDKWIRCFVVVTPNVGSKKPGSVKIYTSTTKSKKHLLASVKSARSCVAVYPENPEFIDNNSLIRLNGQIYINEGLLEKVISGEVDTSAHNGTRSRSSSIGVVRKISNSSLISAKNKDANKSPPHSRSASLGKSGLHKRVNSTLSMDSGKRKIELKETDFLYLLPESHSGVKPTEIMIRLLIPIMNSFRLYGRPNKFISSRDDRESLLFGLPQLPHTQYLDDALAFQLVSLNVDNSLAENWSSWDWMQVFKEMVFYKLSTGWQGSGSLIETFKDGMVYNKGKLEEYENFDDNFDDPIEDFVDLADSKHDSLDIVSPQLSAAPPINSPLGDYYSRPGSPVLEDLDRVPLARVPV